MILTGLLSVAILGVGAQASYALTSVEMGVANNIYPAMKEVAPFMESSQGLETLTYNAAGQVGGFWNKPGVGLDNTRLRGVTSGNLRKQLRGPGPYLSPNCDPSTSNDCVNGPLQIDAFFSADESNVDQVTTTANGGNCAVTGSVSCPGVGGKQVIAIGRLAVFSCDATYVSDGQDPTNGSGLPFGADVNGSGNGRPGSPRCQAAEPVDPPETVAEAITWAETPMANNKLAVASPTSAPFGAATVDALGSYYRPTAPNQNAWPGSACDSNPACRIRIESGISQVRGAVTAGNAGVGIVALSNVLNTVWTSGSLSPGQSEDPNHWFAVDPDEYEGYGPIEQYATAIRRVSTRAAAETAMDNILAGWADDGDIQGILNAYGYETP